MGTTRAEQVARLAAAYRRPVGRAARKRRDQAALFRWDARFERLIEMKRSALERFAKMPASVKVALGHYTTYKRAAAAEGIDTSAPDGAGEGGE